MNEPVKCPDCQTWWRGETHRCDAPDWFAKVIEEIHRMADRLPHVCPVYWPCTLPHVPSYSYIWTTTTGTYSPPPSSITVWNNVTDNSVPSQ